MSNVENLERQVKDLSPEELAAFRRWFLAYDWEVWDRRLEQDVAAGKLDALAEKALRDHSAGKSTKFWITTPRLTSGPATTLWRPRFSSSQIALTNSSNAIHVTRRFT